MNTSTGRSTPRRIGLAALVVVMAAAGWYVFVYLHRWEWNRAVVSGVIFLAAEIALVGTLILEKLSAADRRRPVDEHVVRRIREHAPEPPKPFKWLDPSEMNVFVPVLLGAGVVLSGLAWFVDRIARLTAVPGMERGLARRLGKLQPPAGGVLGEPSIDPFRPR
jgi:hypothetical protein